MPVVKFGKRILILRVALEKILEKVLIYQPKDKTVKKIIKIPLIVISIPIALILKDISTRGHKIAGQSYMTCQLILSQKGGTESA